jgi:saccharopine dehydrogenase-like NADP-dependent oxidoreductase
MLLQSSRHLLMIIVRLTTMLSPLPPRKLRRLKDAHVADPSRVLKALVWLGALDGKRAVGAGAGAPMIDAFCNLLEGRLAFGDGERDVVLMHHDIDVVVGGVLESHASSLMVFGDDRDSAMAKTVGLTCGIAAELVLSQALNAPHHKGTIAPLHKDIYGPMLQKLEGEGLGFEESMVQSPIPVRKVA